MIKGHGDDIQQYGGISVNFSSNVYAHFTHNGLFAHLANCLPRVAHYPEPAPSRLEAQLAADLGLEPSEVMVTSGATEAIYLIAQSFRGCRSAVLEPTFSEYADASLIHDHHITHISSLANLPADASLVWLCVPSNPTGAVLPIVSLLRLFSAHPDILFVLDASYAPYSLEPQLSPADGVKFPNLLMLHSMTKRFGIPGLRLGYVTASAQRLAPLRSLRMPWSVSQPAQDAGLYLLSHKADYQLPVELLCSECRRVASELVAMRGVGQVYPSDSHMLLCRLQARSAASLKEHLARRHGLLIRDASNFCGLDSRHFRIAVQSPSENDQLLSALRPWLSTL